MKKAILFLLFITTFSFFSFAKIMVVNGLTHVHELETGVLASGKITLKNVGNSDERFIVYKNDLMTDCSNNSNFAPANTHPRSLAKWVKTNVDERVLRAGEEYELLYEIQIPNDSSLRGSYWCVFMVEGDTPIGEEKKMGVTISSKARYAIQVVGNVGQNENQPLLNFDNIDFKSPSDSVKIVKVKVKNDGKASVRTKLILDIVNGNGEKLATTESAFRRIYPNACAEYELMIKNLPKGKYEGLLMADYGQDLFATNVDIDIK